MTNLGLQTENTAVLMTPDHRLRELAVCAADEGEQ